MTVSKLLWGTNFENEIRLGYPLFDVVTDREEREGSQHLQAASGVEDAWITGRDYIMETEARWIPDGPNTSPVQTQLSGPVSWQEFLDWARDANPFRFVPDETVPDFYIDNTYVVEPRKGFGSLTADIKRKVQLKLRNASKDFHEALRGVMFEYAPGAIQALAAASFARASAATRRGLPGGLQLAVGASELANVLRERHYEGSLRSALLEAQRMQLVSNPENFGAWATNGTPVLTSGQADPFGGTGAYLVDDNDGAAFEYLVSTGDIAFTDGIRAFSIFIKQGTSTNCWFRISGAVERHRVRVTWTAGVPSLSTQAGSGTLFPVENWGSGWWRVSASANGVLGADTNTFQFGPGSDGLASDTGTGYFFGANAWDAPSPSSYQGPSLATKIADTISFPWFHRPQAQWVFVEYVDRGSLLVSDTRLFTIGVDSFVAPYFGVQLGTGFGNRVIFDGTGSSFVSSSLTPGVFGDNHRILALLFADGSVQSVKSINAGAEVAGTRSSAGVMPASWSAQQLRVNGGNGTSIGSGYGAFVRVKAGPLVFGGITRDTIAKAVAA